MWRLDLKLLVPSVSGVLAGYFFTKVRVLEFLEPLWYWHEVYHRYLSFNQGFKDTALAQLRAEEARLELAKQNNPEILPHSTQNHKP